MRTDLFTYSAVLVVFLVLNAFLSGCVAGEGGAGAPVANASSNSAPSYEASNSSRSAEPETAAAAGMPVTLPLIDAMLADETFVTELRSSLQITDEQIRQLRDASRDAVLALDEDEATNDSRSTVQAIGRAREQINQILGPEKAEKFIALIGQRMVGGAEFAGMKPSSVPTDTRIVVNAPAYRMDVFENGQLKKSYRVGIGYPEFPLPTGLRKAETIVFNPTWTPPDEPWVKGKFKPGRKVEAGSKDNPLGPIKIPIGLPSLIHGGKSASRLGNFASHGCVGLTDSQIRDFAAEVSALTGSEVTPEEMRSYLAKKTETKEVKLARPLPVELRYETIVVEDGKLMIYRDVYERGTNTEENLRRVLEAFGVRFDDFQPADREKILAGLKQMAYDAKGEPVEPAANANAAVNSNIRSGNASNSTGKVTRNVKGRKEFVFELAELKGKGYPAPHDVVSQ